MKLHMWREKFHKRRRRYYSYQTQSAYSSPKRSLRSQKIAKLVKFGFIGLVVLFVISLIAVPLLAFNLPSPDKIVRRDGFSTKILDRNGEVLYDIFVDERRTPVENIDQIPEYLRQATIAIEDKNFYQHSGFDPFGMIRGFSRFFTRGRAQGGSTLTQQLVKNVLLTDDYSLTRKINEFILALQIEQRYSKDDILLLYLNEVPYGGTAYGVQAASETYFGKSVRDLNLVESAILAGLPQSPSRYSPYSSTPDAFIPRTEQVLRRMHEDGYITVEQEQEAKAMLPNMEFQGKGASFKAPHFVQYVQEILEERYGSSVLGQGLEVTTTLDWDLQQTAQQIVSDEIAKVEDAYHITNGASVVIDSQTGEILSMVGSKDFNAPDYDGQVNVTLSDQRQPGSSIKPLVYVAGLNKGYTPSSLFMDVETTFPGGAGQPDYKPVNYDGKYRGPVQLRYALGNSLNIPAVKMLALVGLKDALNTMTDFGITTLPPTDETLKNVGLSLALGGGQVRLLDLTTAYTPFMNGGYKTEPISVLRVTDRDGKVLEENHPQKGRQVVSPENAWLISNILSDNKARELVFGLNSLLNVPGRAVAVKTGTTNDRRDNWAIGGTPQLVVGTWVGNNDNSPMRSVASGVSGASPIWRKIIDAALADKPRVEFEKPGNIVEAQVDTISGYAAHDNFPSRLEYFAKGTEPQGEDPVHKNLKLCKNDGKLANPSDVASGNYDQKEFFLFKEEDPTAGSGGQNRWQEGILAWILGQNNPMYNPPTEFCGSTNPINVEFVSPRDRDSNLSNTFTIRIDPQSNNSIALVELEIDGQKVRSFTGRPFEYEATLSDGTHTLKAIAHDSNGNRSDRQIQIGVKTNWDASPSSTP